MSEILYNELPLQHFNRNALVDIIGDNNHFLNILVKTYFDGFPEYLKKIRLAILDQNPIALQKHSHALCGSSKSVFFEIMAHLCIKLENIDISNNILTKELIEEIENEYQILKEMFELD